MQKGCRPSPDRLYERRARLPRSIIKGLTNASGSVTEPKLEPFDKVVQQQRLPVVHLVQQQGAGV